MVAENYGEILSIILEMLVEIVGDCIQYFVCFNCGRVTPEREFCIFCHMPIQTDPPETKKGVTLGCMEDGKVFRIPLKHFGSHFAFYGVTGSGKTRAAMKLAIESERQGLNLRIIDIEGEWKNLIPRFEKKTVYYDSDNNLRINPFDLNDLALTKTLLRETIFQGIENEYSELSPQMNFLLDKCLLISRSIPQLIENVIKHNPESHFPLRNLDLTRTALLTRLNPYRDNQAIRKIFYTKKTNLDMSSVRDKNLVVDLHGLDKKVAYKRELMLLYNIIALTYLRESLNKDEVDEVKNLFIADEAQLLVPKILKKAIVTDTWATTDFATRLRKRGEALVIITQSPTNIEDDIRKNAQNNFIFRLQDPLDLKTIAGMFGYIHTDEINYFASLVTKLDNRTAIVKTNGIRFPFVIRTFDLDFDKISKKELDKFKVNATAGQIDIISDDEKELYENIKENTFLSNTNRALSLGWHRSRFSKTRKALLGADLIEEVRFKTKLRGAPSRFLKLKHKKGYGRGQFIHEYWVQKIYGYLVEQGYDPKREYHIGDKFVDIVYEKNGKLVGIEVEYKSDWKNNMLRTSKLCDKLVSVFVRLKDTLDGINFVKENNLSNVEATDAYYCYKFL